GVVWKCQDEAFIRLAASKDGGEPGCGPGGSDLLSSIPWMRRLNRMQPHAWLRTGPAGDATAFGKTHTFCLPSGGYVARPDDSVYHFPLSAVDLQTGDERRCVLHVPFKGKVPPPKTNNSAGSRRGRGTVQASGPYLLAITNLRLEGNILEVTLGMEKWSSSVAFDLSKADSL